MRLRCFVFIIMTSSEPIEFGHSFPLSGFLRQKILSARSVCRGTIQRGGHTCRRVLENGRQTIRSAATSPSVQWVKKRVETVPSQARRLWRSKVRSFDGEDQAKPPSEEVTPDVVSRKKVSLSSIQEENDEEERVSSGGGNSSKGGQIPRTRPKSFPMTEGWNKTHIKGSLTRFPPFRRPVRPADPSSPHPYLTPPPSPTHTHTHISSSSSYFNTSPSPNTHTHLLFLLLK